MGLVIWNGNGPLTSGYAFVSGPVVLSGRRDLNPQPLDPQAGAGVRWWAPQYVCAGHTLVRISPDLCELMRVATSVATRPTTVDRYSRRCSAYSIGRFDNVLTELHWPGFPAVPAQRPSGHTAARSSWLNQIEIWFGIITCQSIPTRHVRLRHDSDLKDPLVHRPVKRNRPALRLDRNADDSRQCQTRTTMRSNATRITGN